MTRWCDLHLHSTNSDGREPPRKVVERAAAADLSVMSLTDHSGVSFDPSLSGFARQRGLRLVPGVEVSTTHGTNKFHVLLYGRAVFHPELRRLAFHPTAVKNRIYEAVVVELGQEGVVLPSVDEMLAGVTPGRPPRHPGKWALGSTLVASYAAPAMGLDPLQARVEVKTRYDRRKHDEPDRYVPTERTIALAREVGALPVLAHPWWECPSGRNTSAGVLRQMASFARDGLVGAEVSSRHDFTPDESERVRLIRELALVPFRSSDYHANGKTSVGQFPMAVEDLLDAAARAGVDLGLDSSSVDQ